MTFRIDPRPADGPAKPKLVFFRWTKPGLPPFITQHLDEQVRCLEHHFEVMLIDEDCDYVEVCETHRPDLAVFESGVYAGPRKITGTAGCPEVPKIGFCNADAYCATRSVFLSDMERWGVDEFFTLAVSMAEYTPDIADRLFVWPNFIDANVYQDYGVPKNIPILFTGSQAAHYPWRSRIHSLVTQQFPCMTTPHAGWFDDRAAGRMVQGAGYARLLNAALIAPTCGTIARDVIRKHFEIPASRTCLVTERTAAIEAAGFVDMENAVFAEHGDIVEKLEFLFANPGELRRITDAGFELVHSRHTMAHRDQLLQWLKLRQTAKPGQRIIQPGPFEELRLVPSSPGNGNSHPISGGSDRQLLHEGERLLGLGRLDRAEHLFLRCLNYHFMPEPVLGLTRCHLYGGNPAEAITWVAKSIERLLVFHHAQDPDPIEWAFFLRALLCQGRMDEALRRADQFPELTHPELDRIRWVIFSRAGRPVDTPPTGSQPSPGRGSVHVLAVPDMAAWIADLCLMLRACGQDRLADAVMGLGDAPPRAVASHARTQDGPGRPTRPEGVLPLVAEHPYLRVKRRVKRSFDARRRKSLFGTPQMIVESLTQKEDVHHALLIRTSATERSTRAVLAGLSSNPNKPEILWLGDQTPSVLPVVARGPGVPISDPAALATSHPDERRRFDVVVVGKDVRLDPDELETINCARFVVVSGINRAPAQGLHSGLVEDRNYALVTHDTTHDDGYSVFRRLRDASPHEPSPNGGPVGRSLL